MPFIFGSLGAAFCQGMILGAFIHGVEVNGRNFSGGQFDWASAFSVMTGIAVIFGYALLGSTWLIMKTENITQEWARKVASYTLGFVGIFMGLVSVVTPFLNERIKTFGLACQIFIIYFLFHYSHLGYFSCCGLIFRILNGSTVHSFSVLLFFLWDI